MRGSKSVEIIDRSEYGHLGVEPFVVDAVEIGTFEYKLGIIKPTFVPYYIISLFIG